MIQTVVRDLGRLDVVVNNAGVYETHPILEVNHATWQQAWQRTLATNLLGPAHVMYWAAQHMVRQGGGRIVNISSRGAFRGEPQMPAYGASKAGLNALSQSLAQALAPHSVYSLCRRSGLGRDGNGRRYVGGSRRRCDPGAKSTGSCGAC